MKVASLSNEKRGNFLPIVKGILVSVFVSLIFILVFAFFIKTFGIDSNLINPINQVIKFASILIGVHSAFKTSSNRNILKGALIGALYTLIAYAIFSLLNSSFVLDYKLLSDVCFGAVAGLISAIIVKVLSK